MAAAVTCPHCGAPVVPTSVAQVIACPYCGGTVLVDFDAVSAAPFREHLARYLAPPRRAGEVHLTVRGRGYRLEGRLGVGASSEVFLARAVTRLTQRVVVKLLRAPEDADLLEREHATLVELRERAASAAAGLLGRLLPHPVAFGVARAGAGWERPAALYRYASGFSHSITQLQRLCAPGLDGRHVVWIARRLLEQLDLVHQLGWGHGSVEPDHALVHPRDHGVKLLGWASAAPQTTALAVRTGGAPAFDAGAPRGRDWVSRDVMLAARTALAVGGVVGPDYAAAPGLPPELHALLVRAALTPSVAAAGASRLHAEVGAVARRHYGPPRFEPLVLP